jgi:hypothetical protein
MEVNSKISKTPFLSKKLLVVLLLVFLIVLFNQILLKWYDVNIVNKILSTIQPHWIIDIAVVSFISFSIILTGYFIFLRYRISDFVFWIYSFLFIIFICCRFSNRYEFTTAELIYNMKYADALFLLYASILTIKIWNLIDGFQSPTFFNDPFIMDSPIQNASDDSYKRAEFAKRLAIKIQSELENKKGGSLAIGINGVWGSGKTSFSNLIKEKIDTNNRIVIDFNPWRSLSASKIIEDFFNSLISEIKRFDPALSNEVSKYAKQIAKIEDNIIIKSVDVVSEFFIGSENKTEHYDKVNQSIQKSKKQILIFIDDLDRLDKKEIIEVLRLIRNTANFNNIIYIASYDKAYVLEAVKSFNSYNHKGFLDKIFQFEFTLPEYDPAVLRGQLKKIVKDKLKLEDGDISAMVDYVGISGKRITSRIIRTKRDVVRFANLFLFEIKDVIHEVNNIDFYLVLLLKMRHPEIYKSISEHKEIFFIRDKKKFRLRKLGEKTHNDEISELFFGFDQPEPNTDEISILENFIEKNKVLELTDFEKDTIMEIIGELVKEKHSREGSSNYDYKSFVYESNFHKYFNIQLLETDFPAEKFETARMGDFDYYRQQIFKWIGEGRLSEIQDRLAMIIDYESVEEWQNHLKILVEIGKYQIQENGTYGVNYRQIIDTLNYPQMRNGNIRLFQSKEEYSDYLKHFFETAVDPFVFESNILVASLTPVVALNLDTLDIHQLLFKYFETYCKTHNSITTEFRELYKNCVKRVEGRHDDYETLEGAEELFRNYFQNNLNGSELASFVRQTNPESEEFNLTMDWIKTVFGSLAFFEKYLGAAEKIRVEIEHYTEFMQFYNQAKAADFRSIPFTFQHLAPSRWSTGH